jgi:hypothetical protein
MPTIRVAGISRLKAEVIQGRHNQQLDNYVGLFFTNILLSSYGHKNAKKCRYTFMPGVEFKPMSPGFRRSKSGHATDRTTKQNYDYQSLVNGKG